MNILKATFKKGFLGLWLVLFACDKGKVQKDFRTEYIKTGSETNANPTVDGSSNALPIKESIQCDAGVTNPTMMRRISAEEYMRTVNSLFSINLDLSNDLVDDTRVYGFDNIAESLTMTTTHTKAYLKTSLTIVDTVFHDNKSLIVDCNLSETNCVDSILKKWGLRLYRRPLSNEDLTGIKSVYDSRLAASSKPEDALKMAFRFMLIHPKFLFRVISPSSGSQLSSYEKAERLSYLIWGEGPDDTLLDIAANDGLSDPQIVNREVARLFESPKAEALIQRFAKNLFGLDNYDETAELDAGKYPNFSEELKREFYKQALGYIKLVLQRDKPLSELITSSKIPINAKIAPHFGLEPTDFDASKFRTVDLVEQDRIGIASLPAFLIMNSNPSRSSPVKRGVWFLDRILCHESGEVPESFPELPIDSGNTDMTIKEQLAAHRNNPACASCHVHIDPIGVAFESFAADGKFRTIDDSGHAVDTADKLLTGETFNTLKELMAHVQAKGEFSSCFVKKLMAYSIGRLLSGESEMCGVRKLASEVTHNNKTFRDVIGDLIMSPIFTGTGINTEGEP